MQVCVSFQPVFKAAPVTGHRTASKLSKPFHLRTNSYKFKNAGLEAEEQELEPDKGRCRWCPQGAASPNTTQHLPWKCGHFTGHKYSSSYLPWTTGFPSSSGKCLLKSQVRGSLFDYSSLYCLSSQRSMSSRFGPPNLPLLVLGRADRHPLSLEPRGGLSGRPWSPLGCSLHN